MFLLEPNSQYKYSCLATSELAETSFFDRSSCWLEFSCWMNVEGGGGTLLKQTNPVVSTGKFQEEKLGEDPSSSLNSCTLWSSLRGELQGFVVRGVKLGSRARSEGTSFWALVPNIGRISVFVVRARFFLTFSSNSQILPSLCIQTCCSS